ncbi:hypothetical protein AB0M23_28445 [Streptomyces sp. NPDC052077]|uniref:hypothetical protein n=1 Tax=Streptomyces sp. NPDC052077 TaxID=3154757 RepID=UPI003444F318
MHLYPNRDRTLRQVHRRRDAYARALFCNFRQRLVLGFDSTDETTLTAALQEARNKHLMAVENPAQHSIRRLPDGQIDETHIIPDHLLRAWATRSPAASPSRWPQVLAVTNAGSPDNAGWRPQPREG